MTFMSTGGLGVSVGRENKPPQTGFSQSIMCG